MKYLFVTALLLTSSAWATGLQKPAPQPSPSNSVSRETKIMGKKLGVQLEEKANETESGSTTQIGSNVLGKKKSLVQVDMQSDPDLTQGSGDIFLGGIQLSSIQGPLTTFKLEAGFPPTDYKVTVANLPVGPITVKVDAGVSLQAHVLGTLTPILAIPVNESSVEATLKLEAQALANVEGSVSYWIVRAGVGGDVTVADVNVNALAQLFFTNFKPILNIEGYLDFFSGSIYGFLDYFDIFKWRWSRALKPTLYQWAGFCYDFTQQTQTGGRCVIMPF